MDNISKKFGRVESGITLEQAENLSTRWLKQRKFETKKWKVTFEKDTLTGGYSIFEQRQI